MDDEQRSDMLDDAIEANEGEIRRCIENALTAENDEAENDEAAQKAKAIEQIARIVINYCHDHGWDDPSGITMVELRAAMGRKEARMDADLDQHSAKTSDIRRIGELCDKASFPTGNMPMSEIFERMAAAGDITEDEFREAYEIFERVGAIEVPREG